MEAQRYTQGIFPSSHSQTFMKECMHILLGALLIVVIGVTMMSCAGNSAHMNTQDWVGHHRDELTTLRGLPSDEAPLPHGGSSLVYQQQGGSANQRRTRCRTVFNTDAKGIILGAGEYHC